MDGINERFPEPVAKRLRDRPQPERMQVKKVRLPPRNDLREALNPLKP
jgi:hypothetical protein